MNRSGTLAITIAALSVLGVAFAAVAAPYTPKSGQMLRRLHSDVRCSTFLRAIQCDSRLLHTLQSVQSCLPD
jgi:hypothetical protein